MTIKDAILATIRAEANGEVAGRTVLHKKLYFVSVLVPEDFGFTPHYYGPYSPVVADELGALIEAGFVTERREPLPGVTGPFGEPRRFRYTLGEGAAEAFRAREQQASPYVQVLKRINSHSLSQNPRVLYISAKVHLIVSKRGHASVADIRQGASELGWDLSEEDIKGAVEYLEHLGLVRRD